MKENHPEQDRNRDPYWEKVLIGVLLVAAMIVGSCLRLSHLGKNSLWGDEINMVQVGSEPTLSEVWQAVRRPHSVGYPAFLHYWQKIDKAESMLRFPSVLAGILSLWLIYRIGSHLGNRWQGIIAALLLALSPAAIRFSREVAPYGIQNAVILGTFLLWWRAICRNRWRDWIGLSMLAAASHYLHPLASTTPIGFLLFSPFVWLWRNGLRHKNTETSQETGCGRFSPVRWGVCFLLYGLLIFPQAYDNFTGSRQYVSSATDSVVLADYGEEVIRLLGGFGPEMKWAGRLLLFLSAVGLPVMFRRSWVFGLSLLGWFSGTAAIWLAFWMAQSRFFDYHYLTSHLPALLLFASAGIVWAATLPSRLFRLGGMSRFLLNGLIGGGILGLWCWASIPALQYEAARKWPNYREAGRFLTYRLRPQDRYYVQPDHFLSLKLKYYCPSVVEQEEGFDVFFDKNLQRSLAEEGGILYIVTGKPIGKKADYRRRYLHGVNIQWNPETQNRPGFYEKVYRELLPIDFYHYGLVQEAQGDLRGALAALVQAASETPGEYRVIKKKAEVLYKLGRTRESIESFREALALAPERERWWIWVELGKRYAELGDREEEIECYRSGLKEPGAKEPYLWEIIGEVQYETGRKDEAIESFENALQSDPHRARPLLRLAELLVDRDPLAALDYARRGRKLLGHGEAYWRQIADEVESRATGGERD